MEVVPMDRRDHLAAEVIVELLDAHDPDALRAASEAM
jgi:hypothetical protein